MSENMAGFIRRWWFIGLTLLGIGSWQARLESEVALKAPQSDMTEVRNELREIKDLVGDIDARQRAFFCRDQPAWCR